MIDGTVCRVILGKGFGFLSSAGMDDVFFHASALATDLPFDESLLERRVKFTFMEGAKGPKAIKVEAAE